MTDNEIDIATIAARAVERAGGYVTFDQYDELMVTEKYLIPTHWIAGWDLPRHYRKANTDKLAAFAAVELGLMRQTETGYSINSNSTKPIQ